MLDTTVLPNRDSLTPPHRCRTDTKVYQTSETAQTTKKYHKEATSFHSERNTAIKEGRKDCPSKRAETRGSSESQSKS